MSEESIEQRLRQVDMLHEMSVELLRTGKKHYEKLVVEGKTKEKELVRYKKYLI